MRQPFPLEDTRISTDKLNRTNQDITAPTLRLIADDGTMVGIVSRQEALDAAAQSGLDLVEIQPQADPPVCRLMDFGKFRFEQHKKMVAGKKKQRQSTLKEVKIRATTETADYQVKLRNVLRFLEQGDRVKVSLRFSGREIAHADLGRAMMDKLEADAHTAGKVEQAPRLEGRQMIMLLAPR